MKNDMVQIDSAGRIMLPKPLRQRFNVVPGDKLRLSVEGNCFRLQPIAIGGKFIKKGSVLVFTGGSAQAITTTKVNKMIEQERGNRISSGALTG